jgi:ribose 5-phosphate isomerase A
LTDVETMADADALKRQAALRALEEIRSGMKLGLGSGSTVAHFLELLGGALAEGTLTGLVGIPSSVRTERAAADLGIPLSSLRTHPRLDLTVDGADEVTPDLDLVKGMGGALLREKIIAQASARFLIIADEGKAVARLGTRSPLPVEVVPWEWSGHVAYLEGRGAVVTVRRDASGVPYRTDNANFLLECRFPDGIDDPASLQAGLKARAGVVETGLFLGMAEKAILAGPRGVRVLRRSR